MIETPYLCHKMSLYRRFGCLKGEFLSFLVGHTVGKISKGKLEIDKKDEREQESERILFVDIGKKHISGHD